MRLTKKNTALVGGLFLNPVGPLARKLSDQFSIIHLCKLPTPEARVEKLIAYLTKHPEITVLIGHSGGCITIAEAMAKLPHGRIVKVILLNSGPLPGVKFKMTDPTWLAIPLHAWSLLFDKTMMLSRNAVQNLLSVSNGDTDAMMNNLTPDSSEYILQHVILGQFFARKIVIDFKGATVIAVSARKDRMIGSTGETTTAMLKPHFHLTLGEGHMWSLSNMDRVMEAIEGL